MHIITEKGEIVEGQALTAEETEILRELTDGDKLNSALVSTYLSDSAAKQIAKFLIENYHLTRRHQPSRVVDEQYPEVQAAPEPAPQVVETAPSTDDIPF